VAIYAVAFIAAMQLQRRIWLNVTRPEHRDLLKEPVPDEVRNGFGRVLLGLLVVFGAAVPVGMFAPRYASLAWAVIIPLRLVVGRLTNWPSWRPTGPEGSRVGPGDGVGSELACPAGQGVCSDRCTQPRAVRVSSRKPSRRSSARQSSCSAQA
jgi:hypothetical protein